MNVSTSNENEFRLWEWDCTSLLRSWRVCEGVPADLSRDFKVKQQIGHGTFACVFLCERRCDGELFAVKSMDKRRFVPKCRDYKAMRGLHDALVNEIAVHRLASAHPNVATLYEVYEDDNHLHLVVEYCAGGELIGKLIADGAMDDCNAASITKQLADVIKFLHEDCGIVHCDLKPSNVLLASKESLQIRVVDFGFARELLPGEYISKTCGSPLYMAPEMIATIGKQPRFAHSCDLWSLGVVLFAMVFNYSPFSVDTAKYKGNERKVRNAIFRKIVCCGFYAGKHCGYGPWFPDSSTSSDGVRDLISSLLQTDASKRLTAAQVLEHAWVREAAGECPTKRPSNARLSLSLPKLGEATMSQPRSGAEDCAFIDASNEGGHD